MRYLILSILVLVSTSLWADDQGFYAGGTVGLTQLDDDHMGRYQDQDDTAGSIRVFGGYHFNPYLSAEASVDWLGRYESVTSMSDIYSDYSALTASVLGNLPLGEGFSLYAQLGGGIASVYQDVWAISGSTLYDGSDSDSGLARLWGIGAAYVASGLPHIEFRAGYEQILFRVRAYAVDGSGNLTHNHYDQGIEQFYLGAAYRF